MYYRENVTFKLINKLVGQAEGKMVAVASPEIRVIECVSVRHLTNIVYGREALLNIRTVHAREIAGIWRYLGILRQHRILSINQATKLT